MMRESAERGAERITLETWMHITDAIQDHTYPI
jgi:hypothetical protein